MLKSNPLDVMLGNRLEGSSNLSVKQESPDEAEIKDLAAKMREANRSRLAAFATSRKPTNNPPVNQQGQSSIDNYLIKPAPAVSKVENASKTTPDAEDDLPPIDEESAIGRFGWETFDKCYIPYIFRRGVKYASVRMVETKLFYKYLTHLHPELYGCASIKSYYITETETNLFNEINLVHSDGMFGKEKFTTKDSIVLLEDVVEFNKFLEVAFGKLIVNRNDPKDKCGFIRINGEAVVPYTVSGGEKFVPLFYFEGETDNLRIKSKQLEGWDLTYLKFCCKVQGIRNELFSSESCSVISLNIIKSYFPAYTRFQDYWPAKVMNLPHFDRVTVGAQPRSWTKVPVSPPGCVFKPSTSAAVRPYHTHCLLIDDSEMKSDVPKSTVTATNSMYSAGRVMPCLAPSPAAGSSNGWGSGQVAYNSSQAIRGAAGLTSISTPMSHQFQSVPGKSGHSYYSQGPVSATASSSHSVVSGLPIPHPPPLVRAPISQLCMRSAIKNESTATVTSKSNHLSSAMRSRHQIPSLPEINIMRTSTPTATFTSTRMAGKDPLSGASEPPPLIPAVIHNSQPSNSRFAFSNSTEVIDLSSPPRSPHSSQNQMQSSSQNPRMIPNQFSNVPPAHHIHRQIVQQHQQQRQIIQQNRQQILQQQRQLSQQQQVQQQKQQKHLLPRQPETPDRLAVQQRPQETLYRVAECSHSVNSLRSGVSYVQAGGGSNGDIPKTETSGFKLVQIQDIQVTGPHIPYKISKAYVEGQLVPCINAKPYIYTELLMTLPDLALHFFSNVTWNTLRQVLQDVLGVTLFRGNRLHMQVLRTSGKCQSTSDILPLVQVRDVMQFMPQLKYMFGRRNTEESLSKRQRTA